MRAELGLEKLRIQWGICARKYEEKIKGMEVTRWVNRCWREKRKEGWKDLYGQEREKYYNRNGWGTVVVDDTAKEERDLKTELAERDRAVQRQEETGLIDKARYNARYRKIREEGKLPRYLERMHSREASGEGIRALRIRCGNMEEGLKYWLKTERNSVYVVGRVRIH